MGVIYAGIYICSRSNRGTHLQVLSFTGEIRKSLNTDDEVIPVGALLAAPLLSGRASPAPTDNTTQGNHHGARLLL